jgi:hypothetical protein
MNFFQVSKLLSWTLKICNENVRKVEKVVLAVTESKEQEFSLEKAYSDMFESDGF